MAGKKTKLSKRGTIEQHLDMVENGELRGDELLHQHGVAPTEPLQDADPVPLDRIMDTNYHVDMAEEDREGDDLSGDEHSSGFQGEESELENQPHKESGLPGEYQQELDEETDEEEKHRAS
ncbi:MAG: hypothetical protein ACXWPM_05085 [Bdellovibrionota bacterium]